MNTSPSGNGNIDSEHKALEAVCASLAQLLPAAGSTTVTAKQLKGLQDAAAALELLPCVNSKQSGTSASGAAAAVSCLELLLHQLQEPPAAVFSGFGGAPCEPEQDAEAAGGL
jgi:acetyl-CoA acetyltransferase